MTRESALELSIDIVKHYLNKAIQDDELEDATNYQTTLASLRHILAETKQK